MLTQEPTVPSRNQRTLKNPVEYRGVGLHSGKEITVRVKPAEAGNGVSFVRVDLEDQPEVRAYGPNMKARQRRTCIQDGRAEVYTCEHLLAALYALGIDNAIVEIDGEAHDRADRPARDEARLTFLSEQGYRIVRIAARRVMADVDAVAEAIAALVARPLHQPAAGPPPPAGEDLEG